ncbi:MAG: prephenate dehydrogenase/arogenate dehydrogenase family protein [Candidatus Lokiarchaeota archaeon]|nr:prephenate dehydrogenase/arogenate dehydrogenase family protein [Candidatus Lokiarchaeota archaeon]
MVDKSSREVTIVGATGQMGRWFTQYFANRGWHVHAYSRSEEKLCWLKRELAAPEPGGSISFTTGLHECIPRSAWVLLSVPITAHEEAIAGVAPLMGKDAVLFDIASVKGRIPALLAGARKEHGIHVLSTHPMYGPGAESMTNKNFILIDLEGDRSVVDRFRAIIEPDRPTIIEATADEHDRMIALTLGIPHMLNILFGKLLRDLGADITRLVSFEGTTFHLQHLISQEVLTQEPFIYATIELENRAFIDMLPEFKRIVDELVDILKHKDYDGFIKQFVTIKEYFSIVPEFKSVGYRFNSAAKRSLDIIKEGKEPAT